MTEASTSTTSAIQDESTGQVYARLYGEPLFSIPQELYIPPDALEVFLEAFEGPLDLLLYLIRKQNFDVLDIPMALLTEQYLGYVRGLEHSSFELAGEYLLMAAVLIEIKSRMLLPVPKSAADEDEEDPRAELLRRLLEYEQIKQGAEQLDEQEWRGRDFWRPLVDADIEVEQVLPDVDPEDLIAAWRGILKRAKLHQEHAVIRETLSVRDHMSQILRRLQRQNVLLFTELFEEHLAQDDPSAIVVVHFLAILELAREALIQVTQTEPYAPIYVRLSYVD
ncbi:MAG TPA: segregation/condensation protein A [Paenalcaligenes sp.]|nr:segregation/condensation protein A [Paenalcaligenes sp.]